MKYNILSIRDFNEDSKEWSPQDFFLNCETLKRDLLELDIYDENNTLYGNRREIEALIRFIRNIQFCVNYKFSTFPATATEEEYELIKAICRRNYPEIVPD